MAAVLETVLGGFTCASCGAPGVEAGSRCPACGTPLGLERLVIGRWRGYRSSTFVACADDVVVAESASFRCRAAEPPPTEEIRAAHDELVAQLLAAGWSKGAASDEAWYATELTRVVELDPDEASIPELKTTVKNEPKIAPAESLLADLKPAIEREATPVAPPPVPEQRAPAPAASIPLPASRRRRVDATTILSVVGIVCAAVVTTFLLTRAPGAATRVRTVTLSPAAVASTAPVRRTHTVAAVAAPAPVSTPQRTAVLDVTAPIKASWLEVRRGSAHGRILFSGELAVGGHLHLHGSRFWARFGAAANMRILFRGKPVQLTGTVEHVFAAARR